MDPCLRHPIDLYHYATNIIPSVNRLSDGDSSSHPRLDYMQIDREHH